MIYHVSYRYYCKFNSLVMTQETPFNCPNSEMKSEKRGIARITAACRYSYDGLLSTFKNEEAFRQEVIAFFILLPAIVLLPLPQWMKWLLFSVNMVVLIVELLNTGIEAVVDLVAPDFAPLAKQAKDAGSAAVFVSISLASATWIWAVFLVFWK